MDVVSDCKAIHDALKANFITKKTRKLEYRLDQLRRLKAFLEENREALVGALVHDLHRPNALAHGEVATSVAETERAIAYTKKWTAAVPLPTPLTLHPGMTVLEPEPLGVCLIIGPFNYPLAVTVS